MHEFGHLNDCYAVITWPQHIPKTNLSMEDDEQIVNKRSTSQNHASITKTGKKKKKDVTVPVWQTT